MKVDEFLKSQEDAGLEIVATIQAVRAKPDRVKLTPYSAGASCQCGSSFELNKSDIEAAEPFGRAIWCCGKQLRPAKVTIRRAATLLVSDVISSMIDPHKTPLEHCFDRCEDDLDGCRQSGDPDCEKEYEDCK